MHASTMRINVHACFYIWQQFLNNAEIGSDEENESCSGGFNVYSQHTVKCCQDWAKGPQCRAKGPPNPPRGARLQTSSAAHFNLQIWSISQILPNNPIKQLLQILPILLIIPTLLTTNSSNFYNFENLKQYDFFQFCLFCKFFQVS